MDSQRNRRPGRAATAALVLTISALATPALAKGATTFSVTRTDDPAPGACDADCSLREAVLAANAGSGGDTISIPAGVYRLTRPGQAEDAAATGDLDLTTSVTISGAGARSTAIDAMGTDRAIDVKPGVTAEISGLIITGGGDVDQNGGGVRSTGTLTIRGVTVRDNDIASPGNPHGGGIYAAGPLNVIGSTIADNHAYNGGGIYADGALNMSNSTVSGNRAGNEGSNGDGGGMQVNAPSTIADSTIAFNEGFDGSGNGGGIYGSAITYRNSIVANNVAHATDVTSTFVDNCASSGTSEGHNLSDGTDCGFAAAGDQQGVDPRLLPLTDNGGPTDTHALAAGSPAIDRGGTGCASTDQRGTARPQGAQCDIGAFEVFVAPPPGPATAVSLAVPAKVKLKAFLKGLHPSATPTVPVKLDFELLGTAKSVTLASRDNLILATASLPTGTGARSVTLKPARKLLGKPRKSFRVKVRVTATDAAGKRAVATRTVRVTMKRKAKHKHK